MEKRVNVPVLIFLLALAFLQGADAIARTYTTTFSATENPISESGNWINGKTDGRDWADVKTTGGNAIGTQTSASAYDDTTALVTGTWGNDQTAEATVYINTRPTSVAEVELRLHSSISAGVNSGYEILFSVLAGTTYHQIVRWNGPINNFTYLAISPGNCGNIAQLKNGDRVKASMSGSTITTWIDRGSGYVQQCQATDTTFTSGKPGMGFYTQGSADNTQFGFSDFTATDKELTPSAPVNLRIVP
jgi:hypothetical protein